MKLLALIGNPKSERIYFRTYGIGQHTCKEFIFTGLPNVIANSRTMSRAETVQVRIRSIHDIRSDCLVPNRTFASCFTVYIGRCQKDYQESPLDPDGFDA